MAKKSDEELVKYIESDSFLGGDLTRYHRSPTEALSHAVEQRNEAERNLTLTVVQTRMKGATWEEIAAVLGITHQGARQRYGAISKAAKQRNGSLSAPKIM